jgi:tetratricopeptide (TPR) repeat protein
LKPLYLLVLLLFTSLYACKSPDKAVPNNWTADFRKGLSLFNQRPDSAFYYLNKAATGSKDSLEIAMAYNCMAVIQSDAGDYFGAQESLLTSLKYANEKRPEDQNCIVSDYNELGRNSSNLKNYEAAIDYYNEVLRRSRHDDFKGIALNNQAVSYQDIGQYAQAIAIYSSILGESKTDKKEYARVLSNLADTRWLADSTYQAAPELLQALHIREAEKDDWGLNASYAHLSDYYTHKRPDSALFYAAKMYAVAQHLSSPDDQLEALRKLITLSPPAVSKQYFLRYQFLSDSIQTVRNAAKNQFALIRYDAQKNKADNLRLQKDVILQRVLTAFFIAALAGFFIWYRKRKQLLESKAQNAIRESRLKTSQKVHDVVANGLYRIMTGIEHHQGLIEKEPLLDQIEVLYEQSRDISYEHQKGIRTDYHKGISDLLGSFANDDTKVIVVGNNEDLWRNAKDNVKTELQHVLQELMVNMKKHSAARNVFLRFERQHNTLILHYADDGVGLPSSVHYGNGLTNTGNRIKSIGGQIIFDRNTKKGLKIQVLCPTA